MTLSLIIILSLCLTQVSVILWLILRYRTFISEMFGMLISMALGMGVGLLIGTILGVLLHGNLYMSTIYSILIGLTIGFASGLPLNLKAVIDGSLSGIMGGMMGAMLGEMIVMTNPNDTIKLLSLFITMIFLLLIIATEESIHKQKNLNMFFSKHKYVIMFFITILFIGIHYLGPVTF